MRAKTLTGLLVATAVVVGVAAVAHSLRSQSVAAPVGERRVFPDLAERLNDVAALEVETADGTFRIARQEDGWGLADKGGYPAGIETVRKVLIGLGELEVVEEKTADPERYAQLGVQAPGAADLEAEGTSPSLLVRAEDAGGDVLAALIVGDNRQRSAGARGSTTQVYVRRPDEARSYLASGELQVPREPEGWLDKEILKVERDRVRAVEVQHPDGERLLVWKPERSATSFEVADVPEDRELSYAAAASPLGSALEFLNLQDVLPREERPLPAPNEGSGEDVTLTRFWTFDGLRVDVRSVEAEGQAFATFEAAYDPDGPQALAADGPPAPPAHDAPGDATTEDGAAEDARTPEEVQEEVERLNRRLAEWTYVVPTYNRTNFTKRMSDLLKPETPAGEGEEAPGTSPLMTPEQLEALRASQPPSTEDAGPSDAGSPDGTDAPPPDAPSDGTATDADDATDGSAAEDESPEDGRSSR